jgi:hypothetical protein
VDHVHFQVDQLGRELGEAVALSPRPSDLEDDVSSLDVAEVAKPILDRIQKGLRWCTRLQDTETPNFVGALGVRSAGPRGRSCQKRDKLPPPHWITSSERTSRVPPQDGLLPMA